MFLVKPHEGIAEFEWGKIVTFMAQVVSQHGIYNIFLPGGKASACSSNLNAPSTARMSDHLIQNRRIQGFNMSWVCTGSKNIVRSMNVFELTSIRGAILFSTTIQSFMEFQIQTNISCG